ncbi:796_t:CDS:10 [Racocetra fulgida]|uniref:796_t:CDS:1 n=1 Tax=Racocetra fulgida TaxID=60492 RepID=A0A9N8VH23_9GLOM|nr:796_t:CDS:10 [Racocetra fulgida]
MAVDMVGAIARNVEKIAGVIEVMKIKVKAVRTVLVNCLYFFSHYKDLENKKVQVGEFEGQEQAEKLLKQFNMAKNLKKISLEKEFSSKSGKSSFDKKEVFSGRGKVKIKKGSVPERKVQLICGKARPGADLAFLKNMALFCKEFNDKTKDKDGQIVSVEISVYDDKSHSYNISTPPGVYLLKNRRNDYKTIREKEKRKEAREKERKEISEAELEEIARKIMPSLNTDDIEKAKKIVRGTVRRNSDGKIGDFPTNGGDVNREDIERIRITGPEAELEKMLKLIFLKDDVRDTKNNAKDSFAFEIVDITPETTVGTSQDAILNLTAADFAGALTAENIIKINDTDYNSKKAGTNEPAVVVDRDDQKQALLDLEQKLADLETNFPGGKDFTKGPELTLTDTSAEIGRFVDDGNTGLKSYFYGNWNASTTVPDKTGDENIKHILFSLEDETNARIYENKINSLTKKAEVAQIYANGFTFADDSDEFRKATGKALYKGFPVIDPGVVATAGATKADDITFSSAPGDRYSKTAIDMFRHKDSFPIELPDNIKATNPPIKLFESNKREDCCGFQPGELTAEGDYRGHGVGYLNNNVGTEAHSLDVNAHKLDTKVVIDIWEAATLDEAINLAFFGQDYAAGTNKKPNDPDYLFFNELSGKSELEMLEIYYKAFERTPNATAAKTAWNDVAAGGGREKITNGYNSAKTFLGIYVTNYASALSESDKDKKKTALEKVKTDLQAYVTKGNVATDTNKIGDQNSGLIKQIDDAIAALSGGGGKFTKQSDLNKILADANLKDPAKKVYQAFDNLGANVKTDTYYDALVALIGELGKTIDKPKELRTNFGAEHVAKEAEKQLTTAVAAAKKVMENEGDAITKTEIDIVDSIQLAQDIKLVFEKCKKAHGSVTSTEKDGLKGELTGYQTSKKTAWDKVNQYQKTAGKGYADEALEKVDEGQKKDQATHAKYAAMGSAKEVREEATKDGVSDETLVKRGQISAEFKNSDKDDEKALVVIAKRAGETTEYSDSQDKIEQSLTEIKKHIDVLEKIIKAKSSDSSNEGETDTKTFLESLKSSLESRKSQLETKQKEYGKSNDGTNPTP